MKPRACVRLLPRRFGAALLALCGVLLALSWSQPAAAHRVGISSGKYVADGNQVEAIISLRRDDLIKAAPALDSNKNGSLEHEELIATPASEAALAPLIQATRGGVACTGKLTKFNSEGPDGAVFTLVYESCRGDGELLRLDLGNLIRGAGSGHRHAGELEVPATLPKPSGVLLHADASTLEIVMTAVPPNFDGATAVPLPPADPPQESHASVAREFFVLGVEHIWTGIDHIVFLLGLVMLGGTMRDLLKTVTAFTVSHSITLGLAVLGVIAPSPSIVEPIIALSVAYVGLENFFVKDTSKRWRIAAAFGLIHGFGFAGALGEVALPKASIPVALAMFNLGVEAGQLALLLGIVPLFAFLRKQAWFTPRGIWAVSGAIVVVGLFWFVERVAFA